MRVAVVFRGHKRNWDYVKSDLLNFFEDLSFSCEVLDYYVAVWKKNSNYEEMRLDFPAHRLKAFLISDRDINYTALTGPVYLSQLLNPLLLVEESKTKNYDIIIETRFDMRFKKISSFALPPKTSIGYTTAFPNIPHMDDHCFVHDRLGYSIWHNNILKFPRARNIHAYFMHLSNFCELKTYIIPWWICGISRPVKAWDTSDIETRRGIILDMGLDIDDYFKHLKK